MKITSILAASAVCLLVACGGSSRGGHDGPNPPPGNPEPPKPMLDAFYTTVLNLIGVSENTEPEALEASPTTEPENTEPVATGS